MAYVMNKDVSPIPNIGRPALLLALTASQEEEEIMKAQFAAEGYVCAVTGTGGNIDEMKTKINSAVIGAALNNNVISKQPEELHAIIHAAQEAKQGIMMSVPTSANLAVKIAIVRCKNWIAVAVYGHSAMHILTNHERAGLGVMHI